MLLPRPKAGDRAQLRRRWVSSRRHSLDPIEGVEGSVPMRAGFWISSEDDFGGLVKSQGIVDLPMNRVVGRLDLKIERFRVEEDCDLEPYII
jgi:hypothetical protein